MIRLCLLVALLVLPGFALAAEGKVPAAPQSGMKQADIVIVTREGRLCHFNVELAITPQEHIRGLMFRRSMPEDHGMLFLSDREMPRAFWMKNTLIPLDMLFIRSDGTIRHIHSRAVPHDETPIPSGGPVLAILEINGGVAERLGITEGDTVRYEAFGNAVVE